MVNASKYNREIDAGDTIVDVLMSLSAVPVQSGAPRNAFEPARAVGTLSLFDNREHGAYERATTKTKLASIAH